MKNRKSTFFIDEVQPLNFCGRIIGYKSTLNRFEEPFEISPTEGEHDFNNCEECKKALVKITNDFKDRFNGNKDKMPFPHCCSPHSNLAKLKEFNRASYIAVPEMVARKIIYTNQHIINNHSSENWYKLITNYIDWAVDSFGQMPTDCGERLYISGYFYGITDLLQKNENIAKNKKSQILEYLKTLQTLDESPKTDLNVLLAVYQQWLKEFPFDLNSYFGHLKEQFENQLPILNGEPEVNIYSGIAKGKMHTKSSLINTLMNLTSNLLTQINGVTLFENGLITNTNKIKLELLIQSRKLKLKEGYNNKSTNEESRYRKILKEWLNDEKEFFDKITPLLNNENDNDFIRGKISLVLTPQGNTGYFEVTKDGVKRKFPIEGYYDLELGNWEFEIDKATTKREKLQLANNAIFHFRKELVSETFLPVVSTIERKIKHLEGIIEYINCNFDRNEIDKSIAAPVIRLFCSIVHQSGIIIKGFEESAESFCKRVCIEFHLNYSERVRQYFSSEFEIKKNDKQLKKVTELILPRIPSEAKKKIETYINSKTKLYG